MKNMNNESITLRLEEMSRADEIYRVMHEVYDALEDKSLYVCDDLQFVQKSIAQEGFIVIACDASDRIVGFSIVRFPMRHEDNLARDIGLPDEQLPQVAHLESTAVLPSCRGLGLQLRLQHFAEQQLDHTKYRYLMATVALHNSWSQRNMEKCGMRRMCTKEKYSGLMRNIMMKEL